MNLEEVHQLRMVLLFAGIIQYICEDLKSYCLFSTHFYELTKLEEYFKNLKNFYVGYSKIYYWNYCKFL